MTRRWVPAVLCLVVIGALGILTNRFLPRASADAVAAPLEPIAAQYTDPSLFLSLIKQSKTEPSSSVVTGITVPHHLLATDLIATGFKFASNSNPNQVVILSPDHFNLGDTNVSTGARNFSTVFGELATDTSAVQSLEALPFVHDQTFFYREHGVQAELPFVKHFFPNAKIVVIAIKESTPKAQVSELVDVLKRVITPNSLIVQSTDFSHYLTPSEAGEYDEQTLAALAIGDPDQLFALNEPKNIDSTAAQYVQSRLQREYFHSGYQLLAHKNSQDYTTDQVTSSTSYIVEGYTRPTAK